MKANPLWSGMLCVLCILAAATARAELMYATNGFQLVQFDSATPSTLSNTVSFSGLSKGESIVGIDLRPSNGLLYGVGSSSRLYVLNPATGAATVVGSAGAFTLNGSAFGVDINPSVDRLRLVSNNEQNLRINPNDGTLTATDTSLNPAGNVVAVAYSNNFVGAVSTTLYCIDSVTGNLGIVTVPNGGGPITTVGPLGLGNLSANLGFDISGLTGIAYACLSFVSTLAPNGISPGSFLYQVDLATGAATLVGGIGNSEFTFTGITAATAIPEPSSVLLLGVAAVAFGAFRRVRRPKN